ncbi:MAG: hypothetical protein ACRDJY_12035 [Thermoleophilaceae bacterium]
MVRWLVSVTALSLAFGGAAFAAPTDVDVRVEGSAATPFERTLTTDTKRVVQTGESRLCDGTNGGANPAPGPTMTGALDDAAQLGEFDWEGTWYDSFEDFYIDRIGPDSTSGTRNWGLVVNWEQTERGGCQTRIAPGDELLFAYDIFTKLHLLKLIAPQAAQIGEAFQVKVVDGASGEPIAGAAIEGELTGADGLATLTYATPGLRTPKATRADSVRSNAGSVCIHEPGMEQQCQPSTPLPAADTGPLETEAPVTRITRPRDGVTVNRGPRAIRGRVEELGSGIDRVELVVLRRRESCSVWSPERARFIRGGCRRAEPFRAGNTRRWTYRLPRRLGRGRYGVRARAVDEAGNVGRFDRMRFTVE